MIAIYYIQYSIPEYIVCLHKVRRPVNALLHNVQCTCMYLIDVCVTHVGQSITFMCIHYIYIYIYIAYCTQCIWGKFSQTTMYSTATLTHVHSEIVL